MRCLPCVSVTPPGFGAVLAIVSQGCAAAPERLRSTLGYEILRPLPRAIHQPSCFQQGTKIKEEECKTPGTDFSLYTQGKAQTEVWATPVWQRVYV
jgi:hypothetical protein